MSNCSDNLLDVNIGVNAHFCSASANNKFCMLLLFIHDNLAIVGLFSRDAFHRQIN